MNFPWKKLLNLISKFWGLWKISCSSMNDGQFFNPSPQPHQAELQKSDVTKIEFKCTIKQSSCLCSKETFVFYFL